MSLRFEERAALKVGDSVGVSGRWSVAIITVAKRTNAQIVLSDNSRWTIKTGRMFGDGEWSRSFLMSVDEAKERIQELRQQKAHQDAWRRLERFRWRDLSIDELTPFIELLDKRPKPPLEVTEEHREQGATDMERAYPDRRP